MMIFDPPLNSPEYRAALRKLTGEPTEPRQDWPVDRGELIARHREIASMARKWAIENENKARELEIRDNLDASKKHDAADDWLIENRKEMAAAIIKLVEALEWYDDPSSQGDVARAALAAAKEKINDR